MFYLKSCHKCHGDIHLGKDEYGAYLQCIQCGRYYDLIEKSPGVYQVGGLASSPSQVAA